MAVTAVNPWRKGQEMDTHGPHDSGSVNRVERVGHINRDGDFARKPLPGNMNDGLTPIRRLDPKLQRLDKLTCPLGDQIHGDLASEPADGLTDCDLPRRPVGLAKCHDGGTANVRLDRLGIFSPKQEADHLREKPEKEVRGGRALPHRGRKILGSQQQLRKVASTLALNMHSTSAQNINCQTVVTPQYFDLSMKSRSRHASKMIITPKYGAQGRDQLSTRPAARNRAIGNMTRGRGSPFLGS